MELPICPRCNKANEARSAFCFSCGLPVDDSWGVGGESVPYGRPAGFWIRLLAYVIDYIVLFVAGIIIFLVVVAAVDPGFYDVDGPARDPSDGATVLYNFLSVLTSLSYFTITISRWGATLGHRIVGIRVLRPDGSKLGFWRAFGRCWAAALSGIILFIGFIMIGFRDDKRGLHDLICDTVVVFKR